MASFDVDYDPASWVLVPFDFPTREGLSAAKWAAQLAREQRERGYAETSRTGTLEDYFLQVVSTAQAATQDVMHDTIWALIANDAPGFVMVSLDLEPGEDSLEDFVSSVAGQRANQYEPAAVVSVWSPNLGDGVRITRRDFDENRDVYVSVYYIFRYQGLDLLLSTQSFNVAAVDWALPLFDELLAGVHISVD